MHAELGEGEIICFPTWREEAQFKTMIPGAGYRTRTQTWHARLSWATLVTLRGVFGEAFTYSEPLRVYAEAERQRVMLATAWRFMLDAPADPNDPLSADMFPFQRADVEFMVAAQCGLLGNEAGTGKTVSALSYLRKLEILQVVADRWGFDIPRALPALILCPYSVRHHWAVLAKQWLPQAHVYVAEGSTLPKRRKMIEEARQDPDALLIVNLESARLFSRLAPVPGIQLKRCSECDPKFGDKKLGTARCQVHPKELNGFGFSTVIIDEAHRIGEVTSQITRAVWAITHDPSVRSAWAMTGTPDNVERLWSMMHTVAPHEYPTKGTWIDRYALQDYNMFGSRDIVGFRPDTRAEFYSYFDPRFRRMIKSVVLPQLPRMIRETREISLSPAMKRTYAELDKHLHTHLPDGSMLITRSRIASRTRLIQFASASVEVEKPDADDIATWTVHMIDPSPKIDEMQAIVEDLGSKPFVVGVVHRDMAVLAAARLEKMGIKHEVIMQGVDSTMRQAFTAQLTAGTLRAVVFTIAAGGTGLDMSGVDTMIRLQRPDSLIENIQCEERISRPGAEKHQSLRIIDVVAEGTVEIQQIENLRRALAEMDEISRDQAQLFNQLQNHQPGTREFGEIVARLQDIATRYTAAVQTRDDYDGASL